MSNPLGKLFNREAQNLTAEIENVTNSAVETGVDQAKDQANNQAAGQALNHVVNQTADQALSRAVNQTADQALNQPINQIANQSVNHGEYQADFGQKVAEAATELTLDEERLEGKVDFDTETTPEVASEERAHERNLARAEGDEIVADNPETVVKNTETEAQASNTLENGILAGSSLENGIPAGSTLENSPSFRSPELEAQIDEEPEAQIHEEPEAQGSDQTELNPIEGSTQEPAPYPTPDQAFEPTPDPTFVHNETAIAEGTMEAVQQVISGKKDPKLVDILALYEKSANAMQDLDRGAV